MTPRQVADYLRVLADLAEAERIELQIRAVSDGGRFLSLSFQGVDPILEPLVEVPAHE